MAQRIPEPPGPDRTDGGVSEHSDGDRLDSWKEIAAFLNRDVRTVQRWEKTAGLPVHRHAASRLRTAYAYRSELEVWSRTQRPAGEAAAPAPGDRGAVVRPWARVGLVLLGMAAVATLVALIPIQQSPSRASVARTPPVSILLVPFENETSDSRFSSALTQAVAKPLRDHPGVELVAPGRVARLLRLMRRDPSVPIAPSIARELCLRDGRIRFVLTGRAHVLQSRFVFELELIEPADGNVRESLVLQAGSREDLLSAMPDEVARFGLALLNAAAAPGTAPTERLEQVTTESLAALRLYSAAVQAGGRRQWAASESLARRAIEADEKFASAYAWLALTLRRQGRPVRESLPYVERAVAMSADTSERESYIISGAFADLTGNLPRAVAAYEALLRLHPRDRRVLDLLVDVYARAGRAKDAVDLSVTRAELSPDDFYANVRAAQALAIWQGDRDRARPFVERARHLATKDAVAERPYSAAWLSVTPAFDSWLAGEVKTATRVIEPLEHGLNSRIGRERDGFATAVGFSYLALGRLQQAERAFRQASTPVRQINLAMLALAVGDDAKAREWLSEIRDYSGERPALFARVGLAREAEHGLAGSSASEHGEGIAEVTRGFIAAQRSDTDAAITHLRRGAELLRLSGEPEYFLAIEALARTWKARGRHERAARLLAEGAEQQTRTCGSAQWAGGFWLKLNAELLATFQREGRETEAARLSTTLQQLLSAADADHPFAKTIVRALSINDGAPVGHPQAVVNARRTTP